MVIGLMDKSTNHGLIDKRTNHGLIDKRTRQNNICWDHHYLEEQALDSLILFPCSVAVAL